MKELIEKILTCLPQYLADFGALISGPKEFIAQRNTRAEVTLVQSLVFFGVSVGLVVAMTAPILAPEKDFWTFFASRAAGSLLGVALTALSLLFAWRIVGGKAPARSFFVTSAYFFGAPVVVFCTFLLVSAGVFKVFAHDIFKEFMYALVNSQPMPDMAGSSIPMLSLSIVAVGFVVVSVWCFIAWGAYRQLNSLSKSRSFIAALVSGLLSLPIGFIVAFVELAMADV